MGKIGKGNRAHREYTAVQRRADGGGPAVGKRNRAHQVYGTVQRKADGASSADIQSAAVQGTSGPSTKLPHEATIQQSFGRHDVSGVEAHVGGDAATAAESMNATAFATGSQVAFREAPDLHTAAHEAAHVVQQRGGVQLKGGVGQVGDRYERNADQVADEVVAGRSAEALLEPFAGGSSASGVQRSAVQMFGEEEGQENDSAPTSMTQGGNSLSHRTSTPRQGTQVDEAGAGSSGPRPANASDSAANFNATIVAGASGKVRLAAGTSPNEAQLFTRPESGGTAIAHQRGTVEAPNVKPELIEGLFIGGAPASADVRQGGIGDCYFEAVLLGIVNQDPAKISSMMSLSGASVSTRFQRLDTSSNTWVPATITNNTGLQRRDTSSGATSVALKGAGLRLANEPEFTLWWAEVNGDRLLVHREDHFEGALWGPLMEKSYADYAQQFGKYGRGLSTAEASQGGYDIIDSGGGSQACYPMFYGGDVANTTTQAMGADPNQDILQQNLPALRRLIRFSANQDRPGVGGGRQEFMQVRIGTDSAISRCKGLAQEVIKLQQTDAERMGLSGISGITDFFGITHHEEQSDARDASGAGALHTALQALVTKIDTYTGTSNATNRQALVTDARAIQQPAAHPILWRQDNSPRYRQLLENLGIVINVGTDNGPGRRMVYAAHAYNVNSLTILSTQGQPLEVTEGNVATMSSQIDPGRSTVLMENPHARNEPDLDGNGPEDGVNEGQFTMTLDQFFRNFDLMRLASVDHDPELGDFPVPDSGGPQIA